MSASPPPAWPPASPPAALDLSELLCALTTQGGIALLGYLAGTYGIIGEGRSISLFVSRVALPCLLLQSLATAKLDSLNYGFLGAMLLGKFLILVCGAAIGSRLLSGHRLKSAAIGGLVSTCSNDLAFGMPIVESLYPAMTIYVVLLSLLQNALLNQLCFIAMEAGVAFEKGGELAKMLKAVAYGLATNALVVAPLIGLVFNLAFDAQPPLAFTRLFGTIGNAFSCTSLFSLGMSLAVPPPQESGLAITAGRGWAAVLCFAVLKLVLLPVVASRLATAITRSPDEATSAALADVGYIYGSLPPAPWICGFAVTNRHHAKIVARTLAVALLAAFPLLLATSLTLASGRDENLQAALVFSSVCHGLSAIATTLLLLPLALSLGLRQLAASPCAMRVLLRWTPTASSGRVLSLASFLSCHMSLSPSTLTLTWLQLGFSAAALFGRGRGAFTGIERDVSASSTRVWYTLTNCCRLGAVIACVAVVRASTKKTEPSAFASRKRLGYMAAGAAAVLALTLPFALNPVAGAELDMWIQGGDPQLVLDLAFDLVMATALLLMGRRLLAMLMRIRVGDDSAHEPPLPANDVGLTPLQVQLQMSSDRLPSLPPEVPLSPDAVHSPVQGPTETPGRLTGASQPGPAAVGQPGAHKGWREVAVGLAAALRLTLDAVTIAAELGRSAPSEDDLDGPSESMMNQSAEELGRALLVMRLLSVALTDGQGFLTFCIFMPRFVVAAVPHAATAMRRNFSSSRDLASMGSPGGVGILRQSLGKIRRIRSDTSLSQLPLASSSSRRYESEDEAPADATPYGKL